MNKKLLIGAGIVVVLAWLVWLTVRQMPSFPNQPQNPVERAVNEIFGGVSHLTGLGLSNELNGVSYDLVSTNGLCNDATTTMFSIAIPASFSNSTSTILSWSLDEFSPGTSSVKLFMGTSTSAVNASTTLVNFSAANGIPLSSASSTWGPMFITSNSSSTAQGGTNPLNGFLPASTTDITGGRFASSTQASSGLGYAGAGITVKPGERFSAFVSDQDYKAGSAASAGGSLGGIIGGNNIFQCRYKILWAR